MTVQRNNPVNGPAKATPKKTPSNQKLFEIFYTSFIGLLLQL
jgi:hypothetical protein